MSQVTNQELMQEINALKQEIKEIKGGKQPSTKFQVLEDGAPTPQAVKIMQKAKKGGKYDGVDVGAVENIVEQETDKSPSRNTTLRIMRKISDHFPKYQFKKGKSNEPSELFYDL